MSPLPDRRRSAFQHALLVVADTYSAYHHSIVERLRTKAAVGGFGLLCVTGRDLRVLEQSENLQSIFQIASQLDVAGTIVMAGTLGHDESPDVVGRFVRQFADRPLVTLDLAIDSVSSVMCENAEPMRALVGHVLDRAPDGDIVFLAGHPGSVNSLERETAFRQVMGERGRSVDESLVLCAGYASSTSFTITDSLLTKGRRPSAIIAASDAMAYGAIHAISYHGLRVPDDILVSGFDDSEFARIAPVSISTVRSSANEQMDLAADELMRLISEADAAEPRHLALPGTVELRESTMGFDEPDRHPGSGSDVRLDSTLNVRPFALTTTDTLPLTAELSDFMACHEISVRLHVRISECADRHELFDTFSEGMRSLSIPRAYLVSFEHPSLQSTKEARLLWVHSERESTASSVLFPRERLLPPELESELSHGTLVACGVVLGDSLVGALIYDSAGLGRASMDALAQTLFINLRSIQQREALITQAHALEEANARLTILANTDYLTGLANRSHLMRSLTMSMSSDPVRVVVLFIDLDGFKPVNDTLGHAAGDELLRILANRLRILFDDPHLVSRLGGDEFVVLLRGVKSDEAVVKMAQELIEEIQAPFDLPGGCPVSVGLSVGVARCLPSSRQTAEQLLQQADAAMFRAKGIAGSCQVWADYIDAEQSAQAKRGSG